MKWLNKLERRYGKYAIKNLVGYIVGFNALVYVLSLSNRAAILKLMLFPSRVLAGEVWRLVTFIFIPPSASPLWIFFVLYFYYLIGSGLEQAWGSFKLNVYYFLGMLGTIVGSFIIGSSLPGMYLNLSLFLAFARLYPNFEVRLFFMLPIPVKYLAWFNWLYFGYTVLFAPWHYRLAVIIALLNYLVFFGRDHFSSIRRKIWIKKNRQRLHVVKTTRKQSIHKCSVCGITEQDDPDMQFRYCSKCEGDYEYCMDHLQNHQHVTGDDHDNIK